MDTEPEKSADPAEQNEEPKDSQLLPRIYYLDPLPQDIPKIGWYLQITDRSQGRYHFELVNNQEDRPTPVGNFPIPVNDLSSLHTSKRGKGWKTIRDFISKNIITDIELEEVLRDWVIFDLLNDPIPEKTESNEDFTVQEALNLPAGEYKPFTVFTLFTRQKNEVQQTFCVEVYFNENSFESRFIHPRFLPLETCLSEKMLELITNGSVLTVPAWEERYNEIYNAQNLWFWHPDELIYKIVALAVFQTYFWEIFDTATLFDIESSDVGFGKSTLGRCITLCCYNGFVNTDPTVAMVYTAVEQSRGAVQFDDIHEQFVDRKFNRDLVQILNASHTKGTPAYRVNMEKDRTIEVFDPFGLKVCTRTGDIPISIESRSISISMFECGDQKDLQGGIPKPSDFTEIRDGLYLMRTAKHKEVKKVYQELCEHRVLRDRIADIYLPILTFAKLVSDDLYKEILDHAQEEYKKRAARIKDPIVTELISLMHDEKFIGKIRATELVKQLNERLEEKDLLYRDRNGNPKLLRTQSVSKIIKKLGFEHLGATGHGGYVHYNIDSKKLEHHVKAYLTPPSDMTSPTSPTSLIPPKKPGNNSKEKKEKDLGEPLTGDMTSPISPKTSMGEVGEMTSSTIPTSKSYTKRQKQLGLDELDEVGEMNEVGEIMGKGEVKISQHYSTERDISHAIFDLLTKENRSHKRNIFEGRIKAKLPNADLKTIRDIIKNHLWEGRLVEGPKDTIMLKEGA